MFKLLSCIINFNDLIKAIINKVWFKLLKNSLIEILKVRIEKIILIILTLKFYNFLKLIKC